MNNAKKVHSSIRFLRLNMPKNVKKDCKNSITV